MGQPTALGSGEHTDRLLADPETGLQEETSPEGHSPHNLHPLPDENQE